MISQRSQSQCARHNDSFFIDPPRPVTSHDAQELHMLLLEDQVSDVFLAEELMENSMPDYQWRIVDKPSIETAIPLLGQKKFDIILLDLTLEDMEGAETVAALREVSPYLPIVLYSGSNDNLMLRQALSQGAQFCIEKGKTAPRLVRAIIQSALSPEL